VDGARENLEINKRANNFNESSMGKPMGIKKGPMTGDPRELPPREKSNQVGARR